MEYLSFLELCVLGSTWEGNDVADVLHSGNEEDEALESETETCMGAASILAGIEIPP